MRKEASIKHDATAHYTGEVKDDESDAVRQQPFLCAVHAGDPRQSELFLSNDATS